jgi:uridine phosphorylase
MFASPSPDRPALARDLADHPSDVDRPTAGGRQYHVDLGPGEVAEYVLLPGDPDRIDLVASFLDDVELRRQHREFATVTGHYRGLRVSAVSTGIGADNVEIVLTELLEVTERPTFIRIGSCGALRGEIGVGDLVVSTGALRLEGTTRYYAHEAYPAVADYSTVAALLEAAHRLGKRAVPGITATAPGFFAPQGRALSRLPSTNPGIAEELARQGVANFEMEASAVLLLAGLAGCRAGVVCTVFAQRISGVFIDPVERPRAEADCAAVGLEALRILADMDDAVQAAGAVAWRPGLWGSRPVGSDPA